MWSEGGIVVYGWTNPVMQRGWAAVKQQQQSSNLIWSRGLQKDWKEVVFIGFLEDCKYNKLLVSVCMRVRESHDRFVTDVDPLFPLAVHFRHLKLNLHKKACSVVNRCFFPPNHWWLFYFRNFKRYILILCMKNNYLLLWISHNMYKLLLFIK